MYFYKFQLCGNSGTYSKLAAGLQSALNQWKDQLSEWYRVPSKYVIFDKQKRTRGTSESIVTYRIRIKKHHRPHKTTDYPHNKKFEVTLPEFEFPKYIWKLEAGDSGSRTALKLLNKEGQCAYYWRHGGYWGTKAHLKGTKIMVEHPLYERPLTEYIECTEEQWRESNGQYATSEYGPMSRNNKY